MKVLPFFGMALAGIGLAGCGAAPPLSPPVRTGEPVGVQLMRVEPGVVGLPFRVLLDFENANDTAFIADAGLAKVDREVAHTGGASLQIPGGAARVGVKLGALLPTTGFPGAWTLAGAYFIAREPTRVTASYEAEGKVLVRRVVVLEPRKWTLVLLDVTGLSDPNKGPEHGVGVLRFQAGAETVWCDDVVLMDNSRELVPTAEPAASGWAVRQRGFETTIERQGGQGAFRLTLPTPEAGDAGWRVDEANAIRVCLTSADGRHARTIYSDGREYRDGKFATLVELGAAQAALEAQHFSPAELDVHEELGRVDRNTSGDRNNDGYNEARGSYQLKANGPRIELTIQPRTPRLVRPVLEVAGLPKGNVVVNVDGQVVDRWVRLPNGHVLVEIPGGIERQIGVSLNVR